MLRVSGLTKYFGDQLLFKSISFVIDSKEKIALVGANGSGKTTLLKLIAGELDPDQGSIHLPDKFRLSYLTQTIKSRILI